MSYRPNKIISGGQTGADIAGLDFAIDHGILHGGYCPKRRLSEGGAIPEKYQLTELPSKDYAKRTRANVEASDATLIFVGKELSRGSKLTAKCCEELQKPYLVIDSSIDAVEVKKFLDQHQPAILNIAGSRASKEPMIGNRVRAVLNVVIAT